MKKGLIFAGKLIYNTVVAGSVTYLTYRLLDKKTDEMIEDGDISNCASAAVVGIGEGTLAIAAGWVVTNIVGLAY